MDEDGGMLFLAPGLVLAPALGPIWTAAAHMFRDWACTVALRPSLAAACACGSCCGTAAMICTPIQGVGHHHQTQTWTARAGGRNGDLRREWGSSTPSTLRRYVPSGCLVVTPALARKGGTRVWMTVVCFQLSWAVLICGSGRSSCVPAYPLRRWI